MSTKARKRHLQLANPRPDNATPIPVPPDWKSLVQADLQRFALASAARMANDHRKFSIGQLPVALGIVLDKLSQIEHGQALMTIDARSGPSMSDLIAELKAWTTPKVTVNVLNTIGTSSSPLDQLPETQSVPFKGGGGSDNQHTLPDVMDPPVRTVGEKAVDRGLKA